jgi:hypothetical protein
MINSPYEIEIGLSTTLPIIELKKKLAEKFPAKKPYTDFRIYFKGNSTIL